jgi:hypothetical protein
MAVAWSLPLRRQQGLRPRLTLGVFEASAQDVCPGVGRQAVEPQLIADLRQARVLVRRLTGMDGLPRLSAGSRFP